MPGAQVTTASTPAFRTVSDTDRKFVGSAVYCATWARARLGRKASRRMSRRMGQLLGREEVGGVVADRACRVEPALHAGVGEAAGVPVGSLQLGRGGGHIGGDGGVVGPVEGV